MIILDLFQFKLTLETVITDTHFILFCSLKKAKPIKLKLRTIMSNKILFLSIWVSGKQRNKRIPRLLTTFFNSRSISAKRYVQQWYWVYATGWQEEDSIILFCMCQTWQGYKMRVWLGSSLNINVSGLFRKYLFKGSWSLVESFFKQN